MKIRNPNFADPVAAFVASKKGAIQAWIATRPATEQFITAEQLRAKFPDDADKLTDGMIEEIARALGLGVDR